MMQPSDLDTEIFLPSRSYPSRHRSMAKHVVPHPHLMSIPSQMSVTDRFLADQTQVPDLPTFDPNIQGEKCEVNGNVADKPPTIEHLNELVTNVTPATDQKNEDNTIATDAGDDCGTQLNNTFEDTDGPGFLPVLKNHNFLSLWSGQVFSQLADKVYLVLMIALISSRFQSGNQSISGWVSAIMMAFTIPAILFGSVAGVFVDRWPKKTVLVATNILRGSLVLVIPFLLWLTHGWVTVAGFPVGFGILLGLTFLISTLTQFFAPAEQAAIPLVVENRHLLSANSLYTTTMMVLVVIGFAVGEPLLAIADTLATGLGAAEGIGKELVVGGSYAIAGLLLLLLKTGEKHPPATLEAPQVWQDLRDGLRYLGENHRIRIALIQLVILFSIFAALTVLAVRMAEVIPGLKSSQFGFLLAAGGIGIAAGATLLGQFGQRFSHTSLSLVGSIGITACLIGLSVFTQQLWVVLLLIALLGSFAALVAIPTQTAIQTETPPEMRGKVFGLQNNVTNIALSLPLALAGVAETFIGLKAVFLSLAAISSLGGLFTWYICRKEPENF